MDISENLWAASGFPAFPVRMEFLRETPIRLLDRSSVRFARDIQVLIRVCHPTTASSGLLVRAPAEMHQWQFGRSYAASPMHAWPARRSNGVTEPVSIALT